MILLTILFITLATLVVFSALIIGIGGGVFTIVFADVIVCIFLVSWLIKKLICKKK